MPKTTTAALKKFLKRLKVENAKARVLTRWKAANAKARGLTRWKVANAKPRALTRRKMANSKRRVLTRRKDVLIEEVRKALKEVKRRRKGALIEALQKALKEMKRLRAVLKRNMKKKSLKTWKAMHPETKMKRLKSLTCELGDVYLAALEWNSKRERLRFMQEIERQVGEVLASSLADKANQIVTFDDEIKSLDALVSAKDEELLEYKQRVDEAVIEAAAAQEIASAVPNQWRRAYVDMMLERLDMQERLEDMASEYERMVRFQKTESDRLWHMRIERLNTGIRYIESEQSLHRHEANVKETGRLRKQSVIIRMFHMEDSLTILRDYSALHFALDGGDCQQIDDTHEAISKKLERLKAWMGGGSIRDIMLRLKQADG